MCYSLILRGCFCQIIIVISVVEKCQNNKCGQEVKSSTVVRHYKYMIIHHVEIVEIFSYSVKVLRPSIIMVKKISTSPKLSAGSAVNSLFVFSPFAPKQKHFYYWKCTHRRKDFSWKKYLLWRTTHVKRFYDLVIAFKSIVDPSAARLNKMFGFKCPLDSCLWLCFIDIPFQPLIWSISNLTLINVFECHLNSSAIIPHFIACAVQFSFANLPSSKNVSFFLFSKSQVIYLSLMDNCSDHIYARKG